MAGREAAARDSGGRVENRLSTISELIRQATAQLDDGSESPRGRSTVESLLAHVLGRPVSWLYAHAELYPALDQIDAFHELLRQLLAGVPPEYLTGRAAFHSIELLVTPAVLVPRPETETLVDLALERLAGRRRPRIADVGTGSGAIALALAHARPDALIVATELSSSALRVAARNVQEQRQEARVLLVQTDLLEGVDGRFDLVAANLPYVSDGDLEGVSAAVSRYEPWLALAGGADGLDLMRRLLRQLPRQVRPGGWALLEIGAGQGQAASEAARLAVPSAELRVLPDAWERDRVLTLRFAG